VFAHAIMTPSPPKPPRGPAVVDMDAVVQTPDPVFLQLPMKPRENQSQQRCRQFKIALQEAADVPVRIGAGQVVQDFKHVFCIRSSSVRSRWKQDSSCFS
jgi:hypothetical protein